MKVKLLEGKYIHPVLGQGIEDPYGLIWFKNCDIEYNYEKSLEYAASLNLRLPTKEDILKCINIKFNLGKDSFWSSTLDKDDIYFSFYFSGKSCYVIEVSQKYTGIIQCVVNRSDIFNDKLNEILEE